MKHHWITLTYEFLRERYYKLLEALKYAMHNYGWSKEEAESYIGIKLIGRV
jgi:hypothetical protein